jgi:hypothetical protein
MIWLLLPSQLVEDCTPLTTRLAENGFPPSLGHEHNLILWQQTENVVFEQSRNVVLTAPNFGDAGRATRDDSSRSRPLVALKKAKKNLITQREAADELELSIRQVQRLLCALKKEGG